MTVNILKRNNNLAAFQSSKRVKQIPWLNYEEANASQSLPQFLKIWNSDELYVDDPTGQSFHFYFETKEVIKLEVEGCIGQENDQVPLVEMDISPDGQNAAIQNINSKTSALFEQAWNVARFTLNLFKIPRYSIQDLYSLQQKIPAQLTEALQGPTRFQTWGLTPPPAFLQAQNYLQHFTLGELKRVLKGFTAQQDYIDELMQSHQMTPESPLPQLLVRLTPSEVRKLYPACLQPWNAYKPSQKISDYLNALREMHAVQTYSGETLSQSAEIPFSERLQRFLNSGFHEGSIAVRHTQENQFHSTALNESILRDDPGLRNPFHTYIEIDEITPNGPTTILKLTYSPEGKKAELGWIQKGAKLSGTEVFKLFNEIDSLLKPEITYLFDDAKVFLAGKQDEEHEVLLKMLNSMTSRNPEAPSWYEKNGFTICTFKEKQRLLRRGLGTWYEYDAEKFKAAQTFMRNAKASYICQTILNEYPERQQTLKSLGQYYLNKRDFTLHELFAAIFESERNSAHLHTLYHLCFRDFTEKEAKQHKEFVSHFDRFSLNPILFRKCS